MTANTVSSKSNPDSPAWMQMEDWCTSHVSIGDWIMKMPGTDVYISPFQMQGCVFT